MLGTAAGGGFPQWNCACALCDLSRRNPVRCTPRLQLQAVVSSGGRNVLLNAGPDLRVQIESTPKLQPQPERGRRNTPVDGIVLTSADLDQVLGLLLMREFQPLRVYATPLVHRVLTANSFFRMMERVPQQLTWITMLPNEPFELLPGVQCTALPMSDELPHYAKSFAEGAEPGQAVVGLVLASSEKKIVYTPAVGEVTDSLYQEYATADVIAVDGTFWSNDELQRAQPGTPLARQIGHVPISGEDGMMASMAGLEKPRRVFVHLNNTNPILDRESGERSAVLAGGWEIAEDGCLL
ncbi:pyrroloquinoline quinone biosynthesis protein PqqB [Terriglobus tenax]|uniref:pyrroloquinoline quinone biosynthesis protein PqqB n=1 Tax=Terriglobus tenax TaxID=1111115 RepID=UPI0037DA620E